jgi:ATP-dependent DNA helicase UvrD/PcrA
VRLQLGLGLSPLSWMIRPMNFYADLHIHSKWSRACSQDCDLEHLSLWAQQKGITVVGTTAR